MKIYNNPINGSETDVLIDDETKALSQFYKAFNQKDIQLMEVNWLKTEEISMDNPVGGIKRGWTEIHSVYDRIFNGRASVYVEFYDYSIHKTDNMFFATGKEMGFFKTSEDSIKLDIRTSRIFVKRDNIWRQIHHHGSIDSPALLEMYQKAVNKR